MMVNSKTLFSLLVIIGLMTSLAQAESITLSGYVAIENRFFWNDPSYNGQKSGPQVSVVTEPEVRWKDSGSPHQFILAPFLRVDAMDDERSHLDIREGFWRYNKGSWEVLAGINKVFWGVTESRHLVDIINQTDMLEDVDQEEKLGQPMIMVGHSGDIGELQFFLMPFFRERDYPGSKGRLRAPLAISEQTVYQSGAEERHLDFALRFSQYYGDWDLGAYYFRGTGREPRLVRDPDSNQLTAYYDVIDQAGLDVQYTREAWLWKLEGIIRKGQGDTFAAMVGGFEYTLYQLFESTSDLGLLVEYNWDGRDKIDAPATSFDNDIFIGARFTLNDSQDTTLLIGAITDVENRSTVASIEAERRIGESFVLKVQARSFMNIDLADPLWSAKNDDFLNINLQYHF